MPSVDRFRKELLRPLVLSVASAWWAQISPGVTSEAIRTNTKVVPDNRIGKAYLWVPYYWAYYVHEGHAEIVASPQAAKGDTRSVTRRYGPDSQRVHSRFLRFYPDGAPDPRYPGGPPKTLDDIRYHTSRQLKQGRGIYAQARRIRAKEGTHFFTSPIAQARLRATIVIQAEVAIGEALRRFLPTEQRTIRL